MRAKKHLGEQLFIGDIPSFNKEGLAKFYYSALKISSALTTG